MKNISKYLLILSVIFTSAANAVDLRFGPKIGAGIGYPAGVKEGDGRVGVGFPIGGIAQFDFGSFGIDVGANYRYSAFGFVDEIDADGDSSEDDTATIALGYSSIEIPVTAYYILRREKGFFKFGGGAGLDYGFGKVKRAFDVEADNSANDIDTSTTESFKDAGISQYDIYAIGHFGYEFLFTSWALSLDFQPKVGLVNKIKDNMNFSGSGKSNRWNTVWFDISASFLF